MCYFNNVYCCYLPAHTSHGLQPLDNGPFNVVKAKYKRELDAYNVRSDSTPVDKLNFIRAYHEARKAFTASTITAAWRHTGQWPISRSKAHRHNECQNDVEKRGWVPEPKVADEYRSGEPRTPQKSREIRDFGLEKSPGTRYKLSRVAKAFEIQETRIMELEAENARLKEQLDRSVSSRKRKRIPNPNKGFQTISEALARVNGDQAAAQQILQAGEIVEVEEDEDEEDEVDAESSGEDEAEAAAPARTRAGREIKRPRRLQD